jgi:hypothetical protein
MCRRLLATISRFFQALRPNVITNLTQIFRSEFFGILDAAETPMISEHFNMKLVQSKCSSVRTVSPSSKRLIREEGKGGGSIPR